MTLPVPVPQPSPPCSGTCPLWVTLRDYLDTRLMAADKAVELARQGVEYRFEKTMLDQLRHYPDRAAFERLEARIGKLEEGAAMTTGKVATAITVVVASITIGLGALLSLLHMFQQP